MPVPMQDGPRYAGLAPAGGRPLIIRSGTRGARQMGTWLLALAGLVAFGAAHAETTSFGAPSRLTLQYNPRGTIAMGDFDGDGRNDIAATADVDNNAHLWLVLQRPDGSMAAPTDIPLAEGLYGGTPGPVAFVDLDRDGMSEVVVGRYHTGLAVVSQGSADEPAVEIIPARRDCSFMATGDLDGDGIVDVACHGTTTTITLFHGDGTGGFSRISDFQAMAGVAYEDDKSLRIGDVNGDGRADLVVTSSSVNSFQVYANNGLGGFWQPTVYVHPWSASGVWPTAIEIVDLDEDGVAEIVTASPDLQPGAMLNVFRRGTRGYFVPGGRVPLYDSPTALHAGDLDGDGDGDLLVGHFGFNAISVVANDAGTPVVLPARFELPGFKGITSGIALGHLDEDECPDVVALTHSGIQALHGCTASVSRRPALDFDGDGVGDVLWRSLLLGENMLWHWADPEGYGRYQPPTFMVREHDVQATGDFDGDGATDLFWRDRVTGANEIWSAARFVRPATDVSNLRWRVVGAGDFDGDDRSDLFWRNEATGANTIWRSADSARTQATASVTDLQWRVAGVGDFDGDGRSDVFWRHGKTGANAIWRAGNRAMTLRVASVANPDWRVVGVGDFNADRKDDLVWRNASSGGNAIWLSASSSTRKSVPGVKNLDWTVAAVADYDGDGRSDLFWRNSATGANVIWPAASSTRSVRVLAADPQWQVVR